MDARVKPAHDKGAVQIGGIGTGRRRAMACKNLIAAIALSVALLLTNTPAQAFDEGLYPNLKGQWRRVEPGDPVRFDPSKPPGLGQQAPLTAEYQALFAAGLADL